ncbi:hypothetical protein ADN00_03185 [Ornatilinea apprima]|uniref:Cardiolipin synthase N-terminal domain-containing protein n=1 Tax=Ornatilinea apprima TaxID=1134406 RepID=A0A0P6YBN9_9CHLR|nr:PLD nuclease N-terminal domain-containing protein [Ornatilinea apprima]KPL79344.1 hypothetical protein ADN00_03185 [Ornatilinea apprima]
MDALNLLQQYLPLLIPVFVVQLGLLIFALVDLLKREKTNGPKWLWVIIIVFVNMIGPIVYFIVGRRDE